MMERIRQTGEHDCGPACLAMVTGLSLRRVKEMVGVPTTHAEMHGFLMRHDDNVRTITIVEDMPISKLRHRMDLFQGDTPFDERRLILTVASPNPQVDWHAVVVDEGKLYDPGGFWDRLSEIEAVTCTWGFDVGP